jgi:hypothetical protein
MTKVTFDMDDDTKKKLDYIRSKEVDNRSIQKELEWLIQRRYGELRRPHPDEIIQGNLRR